ncbi:hypothetical protein [Streptomyces sp. NPDC088789]|uniref:hypothetical protein n=1 Tax=Streptomyces sp. NPDC088789 TaxID=3365899 RepID=UPI0038073E1F
MFRNRRKALLVSAAVLGGTLLMTACKDTAAGSGADSPAAAAVGNASDASDAAASDAASGQGTDTSGTEDAPGSGVDTGDGQREQVEQSCGADDIAWSTRSETQAGGYILLMAKAKAGVTCYLPAELPSVAFGSDGTTASPAEHSVGDQIKLGGSTTAYAGINPKTTNDDYGKELDFIIVSAGEGDPTTVSLPVDPMIVDAPVVTSWHTAAEDAVPFGS